MHLLLSSRAWRAWSLATRLHFNPPAGALPSLSLSKYCAAILQNSSNPSLNSSLSSSPSAVRTMATQEKPPVVQELLQANEKYKNSFTNGDLPLPPAKKVAVLACMDARLDPARALGLEEGDAHVIRNAGGRAKDALRSLIISQILLGTKHVVILHHTDCGMRTFSNADIQAKIKERDGHESDIPDFLPYPDDEWGVREDIQLIRDSPHVPKDVTVHGFIYDVKTGGLREVTA